jgi:hypothetical protein
MGAFCILAHNINILNIMKSPLTANTETLLKFYWKIMKDNEAKPSEKMAAAKEFTKLKGLSAEEHKSQDKFILNIHLTDECMCKKG